MAEPTNVVVNTELKFVNEKACRALAVVLETLQSVAEDFGYRDDVKRAVKACNYLTKHLTVTTTVSMNGESGQPFDIPVGGGE